MPMEYMNEEARRRAANGEATPISSHCSFALWTVERCEQLAKLERLIERIRMADKGSSFVRSFQDAEKLAEELGGSWFPERSFIQFLNDVAIESRQRHKEQTGRLPD